MRIIEKIIIHCSDTPYGIDFSASDIDGWHRDRGFNMIGYHYVIRLDGSVEIGRPESVVGAHCLNHNYDSIGICYIGGRLADGSYGDSRTTEQYLSMHSLVSSLLDKYPDASVYGHCDFSNKLCPCFDVHSEDW